MAIFCLLITLFSSFRIENSDFQKYRVLERLHNERLYYNIVVVDNKAYVGTSEGVFEVNEALKKINSIPGYVSFNYLENTFENHNFIEGELSEEYRTYVINSKKNEGFTAEMNNRTLIVHDNILYIYGKAPYSKILIGKSIRSISNNYIGSYSGIYDFNQKRIFDLEYTNGKIREFKNKTFICYDGLFIITPKDTLNFINPLNINTVIDGENIGFSKDITEVNNGNLLLVTSEALYLLNNEMKILNQQLFKTTPLIVFKQYFPQSTNIQRLMIIADNNLLWLNPETLETSLIENLEINPTDSVFNRNTNTVFLSSNNGVYSFNITSGNLNFLGEGNFHSISIYKGYIILINNQSLVVFDVDSNRWYNDLINDEFNKGAIHVKFNEHLFLGTTGGLYVLDSINELLNNEQKSNNLAPFLILLTTMLLGLLGYSSMKKKSRSVPPLDEKAITFFIEQNLANVDVAMISDNFKVSRKTIYNSLKSKKPGGIIRLKRIEKAIIMKEKGANYDQISKVTGLSKNYLKNNFKRLKKSLDEMPQNKI